MNKKISFVILIIIALVYYWLWPFGRLLLQSNTAGNNLNPIISSIPAPIIEQVYVIPSYNRNVISANNVFSLKSGKNIIIIVGSNFLPIDANNQRSVLIITINGHEFIYPGDNNIIAGFYVQETQLTIELDSNLFSDQNKITVNRDGKISNIFSLTGNDINRQLTLAQSNSPAIIAAIPISYTTDPTSGPGGHNEQGAVFMRFLITGWSNIQQGVSEYSNSCILKIDDGAQDCFLSENLNLIDYWNLDLKKTNYTATLVLNGTSSTPYQFDTSQFLQYMEGRQTIYDGYFKNLAESKNQAGSIFNKNTSLLALGINIFLTIITALLFRPWRFDKKKRWIMTFIIPILIPIIFYSIFIPAMFAGGGFGAGFAGALFGSPILAILNILYISAVPLLESIIVALIVVYSIKSIHNLREINNNLTQQLNLEQGPRENFEEVK